MSWREAAYIDLEFLWQMETGFPPIDQGGSDLFVGITECLVATAAVPTDEGAAGALLPPGASLLQLIHSCLSSCHVPADV